MRGKRAGENSAAAGNSAVAARTRSKSAASAAAPAISKPLPNAGAARVKAARAQAAAEQRAAVQRTKAAAPGPGTAAEPPAPPTGLRSTEAVVEDEATAAERQELESKVQQMLRSEQEDACVGQLRVLCGFDGLPPSDLKFFFACRVVAPLFLPGFGEINNVEAAHEALHAMLERFEAQKLNSAEESPVARRAALSYLQSCIE